MTEVATRPNRVELKVSPGTRHEEATADAVINPGDLCQMGLTNDIAVHATAGGRGELLVAKEDALQGKDILTAFAAGDPVPYLVASPGDELFMRLALGTNYAENSFLTSAGDGSLKAAASGNEVIAMMREALDLSAAVAITHGKVRIVSQSQVP